jgi:tRNA 2-thiouridine synthesizing protein A
MSFIRYYLVPMIKHWRVTLKLFSSLSKSKELEWSEITPDELYDRVNSDQPPLLIDIRAPKEFNGGYGHLPNALSIPVLKLESHLGELEPFREKEIVTMCPGGGLSLVAVDILEKAGFTDVKSLKGGTDEWHQKGYPTTASSTDEEDDSVEMEVADTIVLNGGGDEAFTVSTEVHRTLDARGLSCPMPIMKSMQEIKKMRTHRVLEILTTDPGSLTDIPKWAIATGQELIAKEERGPNDFRFLVKKLK